MFFKYKNNEGTKHMDFNKQKTMWRNEKATNVASQLKGELWHYTDVNALNGILNDKEIWFGNASNMNDKNELSEFINDLKKEVFLGINEKGKNSVAEEVFKRIQEKLKSSYPYIFCVSQACDDAAQWERYADDGRGYAIVFNTEILSKVCYNNDFTIDQEFYDCSTKRHELKDILVNYILTGNWGEFENMDGYMSNLVSCAKIHKHKSFSAEQEVRISPYYVEEDDLNLTYKLLGFIKRVYVVDLNKLCKKANVQFDDLITAIVIGPKSGQNIEDLKWYLNKIGLPKLIDKIRISDCPLR